jgi:hypothetical protein
MPLYRVDCGDVVGEGVVDGGQRLSEFGWCGWLVAGVEERAEEPGSEFGVEDGGADAFGGGAVGVGAGKFLDQSAESEFAQVVAHLVGAVVTLFGVKNLGQIRWLVVGVCR